MNFQQATTRMEAGAIVKNEGYPQSTFYIAGPADWDTFQNRTTRLNRKPVIIVADSKRNEIGPLVLSADILLADGWEEVE